MIYQGLVYIMLEVEVAVVTQVLGVSVVQVLEVMEQTT